MNEKPTAESLGLHANTHERWTWFSQIGYKPPQEDVDTVREAFYQDYEYACYKRDTFEWLGNVKPNHRADAQAGADSRGLAVVFLKLPMPAHDPSELPDDEPPSGWDSAWGEDPRE